HGRAAVARRQAAPGLQLTPDVAGVQRPGRCQPGALMVHAHNTYLERLAEAPFAADYRLPSPTVPTRPFTPDADAASAASAATTPCPNLLVGSPPSRRALFLAPLALRDAVDGRDGGVQVALVEAGAVDAADLHQAVLPAFGDGDVHAEDRV